MIKFAYDLLWAILGQYDVPRYALTTLPFEVIVEIIKDLDWHLLLRIRQVRLRRHLRSSGLSCRISDMQASQCCIEGLLCLGNPISSIYGRAQAFVTFTKAGRLILCR